MSEALKEFLEDSCVGADGIAVPLDCMDGDSVVDVIVEYQDVQKELVC